ncbi:hypothetical protein [Krasilnikovia sp. MM14-A1004]|uniref:hypothetical protein n=1 Tax=Krasilnikovia sp. MM14-A1004 TaxID=3373541 RepID=UPI00399CF25E
MIPKPYEGEDTSLSDHLAAYYRHVVATHADDPIIGACLICRMFRCEDWRSAAERLIYAGRLAAPLVDLRTAATEDGPR